MSSVPEPDGSLTLSADLCTSMIMQCFETESPWNRAVLIGDDHKSVVGSDMYYQVPFDRKMILCADSVPTCSTLLLTSGAFPKNKSVTVLKRVGKTRNE